MPQKYWDEAFLTATFLINRLPTPVLSQKTPFEMLFHVKPDYSMLKVFGCACYPHLRPYNHNKLSPRSKCCTFVGYSPVHKGFRCLSEDGKIFVARNVVFDENTFPFSKPVLLESNANESAAEACSSPLHVISPVSSTTSQNS